MKLSKLKIAITMLIFQSTMFSQQTRKVLFLGNSYTYYNDLPQMVSNLANSAGDNIIYDSYLPGGYTLLDHSSSSISQNKILSNDWDYIVLQEQSQTPAFQIPFAFMDGFFNLKSYINQNIPCAQITSFMTWGHENGDLQNCSSNPNVCTYTSMQNILTERYMSTSNLHDAEVTPVGVVWKYIRENHPNINLYQTDGSHPSVTGSYIAACCFYTSLFRKDPMQITENYGLDPSIALLIRNTVKNLVFNQMLDWYIGKYVPNSNFTYNIGNGINEIMVNQNSSSNYTSLIWDFGDGFTSNELLPTHNYTTDGTYNIKLTTLKCYLGQNIQSIFEQTINFCTHSNTIFPDNLILCPNVTGTIWTQQADSYQWLDHSGIPIEGATNQSIEVTAGNYYSVLTTINGCTERSKQVLVDGYIQGPDGEDPCNLNAIDNNEKLKVFISPNPVSNILNIHTLEEIRIIEIYDLIGNKVTSKPIYNNSIDVSNISQGIYIIKIISKNEKTKTSKFIKE